MNDSTALRARVEFHPDEGMIVYTTDATTMPYRLASADAFKIPKGATWIERVSWKPNEEPIDLSSGYTASFTVRESPSGTALVNLTSSSGITLSTSTQNITITLTSTETDALTFTRAWAQLSVTETSGTVVTRLVEGFIDVTGNA